ncbi:molybdenum ABC transporter ATP-binding protein [Parvibaculum sp.]|uniref:molybdenum ABC transporter ATP-binding protein n=1 Tax=Parvibaculum sp. TaxID=2024848 RepID=UPI003BA8823A
MNATLSVEIKRQIEDFTLDVAFDAPPGVTGIIGRSGAGKTMTLQAIAGLSRPESARIALGSDIYTDTARNIFIGPEKRHIGYVFQEARLFPHLTVAGNLDYGLTRRGPDTPIPREEVIGLLGLRHLLDRRPHGLSGGEAQRVAIGRALLSAPHLLLMDEPLANLDIARRREIMPFLEALHERLRLPVIFVSHNMEEVVRLADRVVVFEGGRVAAKGDMAEVLNRVDVQNLILGESGDDGLGTILNARIESHDDAENLTEVAGNGFNLFVQRLPQSAGASVRLRLRARDVTIATAAPHGLSVQNVIEGNIEALEEAGTGQVDVSIRTREGETLLHALVTGRAARLLNLETGMPVWGLIKTVAIAGSASENRMADLDR